MFIKISEQFTTAIKPFNRLIEINTKSFAQLLNLQKTVFTGIGWELAAQTKTLSTQTDLTKAINDQKYYSDRIQTKVSTSAQKACEVASQSSKEIVKLVQGANSKVDALSK